MVSINYMGLYRWFLYFVALNCIFTLKVSLGACNPKCTRMSDEECCICRPYSWEHPCRSDEIPDLSLHNFPRCCYYKSSVIELFRGRPRSTNREIAISGRSATPTVNNQWEKSMDEGQNHDVGYKIITKTAVRRIKRSPKGAKRRYVRIKWIYKDVLDAILRKLRVGNLSGSQEIVTTTNSPPWRETDGAPPIQFEAEPKQPEISAIINGMPATFSDVPWQAGIRFVSGTLDVHKCGGIIVSSMWIMTAAHCFLESHDVSDYRIRVGDIDNTIKEASEVEYDVQSIIIHPSFKSDAVFYDYDIALVQIVPINNVGIQFNDNVKSVLVPGATTQIYPLTGCTISGWGRTTQVISDPGATVLQKASVDIFNSTGQAECNRAYANMITNRMICAGPQDGSGVDACVGDSGGPLVCKIQGHDVVVGITSWGTTVCGVEGFPGIYTNVQYFLNWLYNPS